MSVITLLVVGLCCLSHFTHGDVVFNTTRLNSPRDGVSLIEAGSDLLFVGGLQFHTAVATDKIEVLDLKNRTWKDPIILPTKRAFVTPVVIEPHIYFVGGFEYSNPPYIYDEEKQEYRTDYGQGPTVSTPNSISLHESTLTVLGTFSVDFFDLNTKNWNHSAELTRIKISLIDSLFFVHEDIVVLVGGTNVTSGEQISTAWIYNRTTDILDEFPQVLTAPTSFPEYEFEYSVTNNVIAAWTKGIVLLHKLGSQEWHELTIDATNIADIFSSQTVTFLFEAEKYRRFSWIDFTLSDYTDDEGLTYPFTLNGYVCYIFNGFRKSAVYYYDDTSGQWNSISINGTVTKIRLKVETGDWACLANPFNVIAININIGVVAVIGPVIGIQVLFPGNNSCHFIYGTDSLMQRYHLQFRENNVDRIDDGTFALRSLPVAIIGNNFFTDNGGVGFGNLTVATYVQLVDLTASDRLWAANDKHFVIMKQFQDPVQELRNFYSKVDIYDMDSQQWQNTTVMPFNDEVTPSWYLPATALGGKLVVWKQTDVTIYDPLTAQWSEVFQNATAFRNPSDTPIINARVPVVTVNGTAYLRTQGTSFAIHRADSPQIWTSTPEVDLGSPTVFAQYFALDDGRILLLARTSDGRFIYFAKISIYDPKRASLDISLFPELSGYVTLVPVGQFIVGFSPSLASIFYYEISSGQWFTQYYNSSVLPSAVYQTSQQLSVVVGGQLPLYERGLFSDAVLLIEHDSITAPPLSPQASNQTVMPPRGLSDGELAAIVVPSGAALIAGALVLILLMRKKRNQKRARGSTTTGLAARYGQWFIPFDQIKFGEQIGRGGSGQVFKGSWKGSSVALKVSMTQANSTIIGELELMMQMRPHPNVVQLFGFSVHPETDSIILMIEFCDGGSLDELLFDSNAQVSLQQKTALLLGIAGGLSHLHANKIVHRDVASRNVLIHKNDAKLTDFGMSRLIEEGTQRGTTKSELGPIRWMAPESLKNKEYSVKSDVWSFGVLMYEIMAQKEPHTEADPIEIGRLIRDNGLTPVIPDTCPSAFADMMRSCWTMSAEQRPSIEEIVAQLESLSKQSN